MKINGEILEIGPVLTQHLTTGDVLQRAVSIREDKGKRTTVIVFIDDKIDELEMAELSGLKPGDRVTVGYVPVTESFAGSVIRYLSGLYIGPEEELTEEDQGLEWSAAMGLAKEGGTDGK